MPTTCKLIAKNVLGSDTASVTFSSIPGTYTDLLVVASARSTRSAVTDDAEILFNSSSSNFSYRTLYGTGAGAFSGSATGNILAIVNAASNTASTFGSLEVYIPNYAGSTNKSFSVSAVQETNATTAYIFTLAGLWSNTAAITSITLDLTVGSYVSGSSFFLYGITKA